MSTLPSRPFFSFTRTDGLLTHETEMDAREEAAATLRKEGEHAEQSGRWDENVTSICWGVILGETQHEVLTHLEGCGRGEHASGCTDAACVEDCTSEYCRDTCPIDPDAEEGETYTLVDLPYQEVSAAKGREKRLVSECSHLREECERLRQQLDVIAFHLERGRQYLDGVEVPTTLEVRAKVLAMRVERGIEDTERLSRALAVSQGVQKAAPEGWGPGYLPTGGPFPLFWTRKSHGHVLRVTSGERREGLPQFPWRESCIEWHILNHRGEKINFASWADSYLDGMLKADKHFESYRQEMARKGWVL